MAALDAEKYLEEKEELSQENVASKKGSL